MLNITPRAAVTIMMLALISYSGWRTRWIAMKTSTAVTSQIINTEIKAPITSVEINIINEGDWLEGKSIDFESNTKGTKSLSAQIIQTIIDMGI